MSFSKSSAATRSSKSKFEESPAKASVNDAHFALVNVLFNLLNGTAIAVSSVRSVMRVQVLKNETEQAGKAFESELSGSKAVIAAKIGTQLLKHNAAYFARAWRLSDLLALFLPLRQWRKHFFGPMQTALARFNVPSGCRVDLDVVFELLATDPVQCQIDAVKLLDHIETVLRNRGAKDYGRSDKRRSMSSSSSSTLSSTLSSKKRKASAPAKKMKFCTACGKAIPAAAQFCDACGEKQ